MPTFSKKLGMNILIFAGTFILAMYDKLTGNTTAIIMLIAGSYNIVQGRIDEIKAKGQ